MALDGLDLECSGEPNDSNNRHFLHKISFMTNEHHMASRVTLHSLRNKLYSVDMDRNTALVYDDDVSRN